MAKYKPKIIEKILESIRNGTTNRDSAVLAGITEETFYKWVNSKRKFSESVTQAQAQFTESLVTIVREAAPKDPKHAEWLLERLRKDDFSLRNELTGADGKAFQINVISGMLSTRQKAPTGIEDLNSFNSLSRTDIPEIKALPEVKT